MGLPGRMQGSTAMNGTESPAYGLWGLVLLNSLVFIAFAFSFFKPATSRDRRVFGTYSAFIVALFVEMYGVPLTIYFLSGWLQSRFPDTNLLSHDAGHLWWVLTGQQGNPHAGFLHVLSFFFLGAGFLLLARSWHVLYAAQRRHRLADSDPYAVVRHPQYVGFVLIMLGFLLQWPTLLTLIMFPALVMMYARLARTEERDSERAFGQAWRNYAARTPAFIPRKRTATADV
jgi:protein-S-isoprenylcysteine O-methyltransferase Ste14